MRLKTKSNLKKTRSLDFLLIFLALSTFLIPLNFFGFERLEDYYNNLFSLKLSLNNKSFFMLYYDLIGPGSRMPLGYGLDFLFLPIFFINKYIFFYFFTLTFCFYLQINYWKKIQSYFGFNHSYLYFFIYCFGITPIFYILSADAIKIVLGYSLILPIFYYLLKYFKKKQNLDLLKLTIFFSYCFVNTHVTYVATIFIFIAIFTLLNNHWFFIKKKVFYFSIFIFLIIISEHGLRLYNDLQLYEDSAQRQQLLNLSLKHFTSGIVFIFKFFEHFFSVDFPYLSKFKPFDNFYLPFNGLVFYFGLFESFKLILKKNSKNFYYINYIFLILILISISDTSKYLFLIDSGFIFRDLINFTSILLFMNFLKNIHKVFVKNLIVFTCVLPIIFHLFLSIEKMSENNQKFNPYKVNKDALSENQNPFFPTDFKIKNNSKFYLSEKIWNDIEKRNNNLFINLNIFYFNDLIKYSIHPFNYNFKNSAKSTLRNSKKLMYTSIDPRINEINNELFFELFHIEFLMIYESELQKIDMSKFSVLKILNSNNDNIILMKRQDYQKLVLKKEKKYSDFVKRNCGSIHGSIDCMLSNKSFFEKRKNIIFNRHSMNNYTIENQTNENLNIILPFLYDSGWKSSSKISNVSNRLMTINVKANSEADLYYSDTFRIILTLVSKITFLLLIFFVLFYNSKTFIKILRQ
jgi:hypothetical protein